MEPSENYTSNLSDATKTQFTTFYSNRWSTKDPSMRNFFVDTDTLEVHSQYWEHMTIVPILATIMLAATVFLLILFKQSPSMVAGTVAACLTIIGIYLLLDTLKQNKLTYQ